ncbi:MAG: nitrogen fixation protein NifX [Nitrospirae bacterium]|nr:nitrogen fixation protein NifX [Nitrospirota bacterium]
MKVAFATQDLATANAHFGWARHIMVYEVTPDAFTHVKTYNFAGNLQEDGDEDKLIPKLKAVKDCAILYVAAIGASGAARVVAQKVHPLKVKESEPIVKLLEKLQAVLGGTPPPWLRKAMQKGQERVLDFEED